MGPLTWLLVGAGELGAALWLLARGARGFALDVMEGDELAQGRLAAAFWVFVWRPLAVLVVLAGLAGLIAGLGASQVLRRYHAELAIEPALARTLARDVVPLLVGVFAAGRVSVELAARIGGMRLGREFEALEALGQDPARYVLSPALAAVIVAAPIHVVAAFVASWAAVGVVLRSGAVTPWPHYVGLTLNDATARVLLLGVGKALVFSIITAGVGAVIGSREMRGPAAIGAQSTLAFTCGLLGVFAVAALWSALR
ncbi:MAG TPA: ABC transporter permease [Caulobacteraceae bacterium]|nr:ABC transporter permease [Caulobacteraceae bacterium]